MLVKIHEARRVVVALCDKEIFGKKFEEGKKELDLTGNFFNGEEKSFEEMKELLIYYKKEDASFNIVGEKSCSLALKIGLINSDMIEKVDGIPYSLVLL
ncbi:MAG: DUF424 family protein [Candidatus Pacearchaeota archaeon]